ncbi:hypothetical protein NECAME_14357 [Necator americanus]|uniref:SCP domain-containing protein n=1 Tax=Necator americanus TaxID=51031 RepID=W2SQX0_NECAM|nr:hypothetical protein NECAME_14357 [Necator americanus]ETN71092.1 hypothetical protein NECAME_14357 [Necator americanus]
MLFVITCALIALRQYVAAEGELCPASLDLDLQLTEEQRRIFLNGHNDLRRRIAHGTQANKNGLPSLGPAKNIGTKEKLMWEMGQPCQRDDECTTFDDSKCNEGLCELEEDPYSD